MSNLIFSLNSTMPIFFVMVVGYLLGRMGFIPESFCKTADKLTFKITLPLMLFMDLISIDLKADFDLKYVGFCAAVTLTMIIVIWTLTKLLMRDKSIVGEFVQGCYRSSAAVLGTAFIANIYGTSGMTSLMILGSVPLFNVFAVLVLTIEAEDTTVKSSLKASLMKSLKGIVTNPIIIGIFAGVLFNLLPIKMPVIIGKTMSSLASLTTPLALLSIGASFKGTQAIKQIKPTVIATFIKLMALVAVFIPMAVYLGFRDEKLVALLIMLGSPSTPSGYVMAKNMGHKGVLASSCIVLTTLMSAFTLTLWLYILRSLGYIG